MSDVPEVFQPFYKGKMNMKIFSGQDVIHLVNKHKNRGLKVSYPLKIGNFLFHPVIMDLMLLIQKVPGGVYGLTLSDLDSIEKMNSRKTIKICNLRVENTF